MTILSLPSLPNNSIYRGFPHPTTPSGIEGQFESFVQNFYQNGMVAFAAENYESAREEFEKVLAI